MTKFENEELIKFLENAVSLEDASIEEIRAASDARSIAPLAEGASCTEVSMAGIAAERHDPANAVDGRVVLHFHGGGYVTGSPKSHRAMGSNIAAAAGAKLYMVEYRLAPEHPFPAAFDDCFATYKSLLDDGYKTENICVVGDSAGGGLAVAVLVKARELGLPMPSCCVILSPWTNLTLSHDLLNKKSDVDPTNFRGRLQKMVDRYLGDQDVRTPFASPLFADLTGLPPLLVHVGSGELLRGDAEDLHAKALADGVASTFEAWPDMVHVWHHYANRLSESRDAIVRVGEFIKASWQAAAA